MEELEGKLITQLNKKFINTFQKGSKVLVTLMRFDRMRDVDELKACIESLPMTKSVIVFPVKKDTVSYEVLYLGNPSDLQLSILKKSQDFKLRGLRIKKNNKGEIWFRF